jgi:hypothetical protein
VRAHERERKEQAYTATRVHRVYASRRRHAPGLVILPFASVAQVSGRLLPPALISFAVS